MGVSVGTAATPCMSPTPGHADLLFQNLVMLNTSRRPGLACGRDLAEAAWLGHIWSYLNHCVLPPPVHTQSFDLLVLPWSHPTGGPAAPWCLFLSGKKVFCIKKEENLKISQAIGVFIINTKVYPCCFKQSTERVVNAWKLTAA